MYRFLHNLRFALPISLALFALLAVGGLVRWAVSGVAEAKELRPFVHQSPSVSVVFTSRTTNAPTRPATPEGEGFTFPGSIPWAAPEGRLRRLDPDGTVYELTWGRPLPDGGTLVDVMSPSITLDGERILFAGRRASPDPGRWRIYEVGVNGSGLRQLTGGPDDPGCIALPPMRYAVDGSQLPPDERKRIDYDDVDPTDCGLSGLAFASSRLPDFGRDHSRRATQIWLRPVGDPSPTPLTANRNNDRWPYLVRDDVLLFSLWSRNREVISTDGRELVPYGECPEPATNPTDQWIGARVMLDGSQFGYAVKPTGPVWRPRPLFNGRIAFATGTVDRMRLAQADWGYLRAAPSSLAAGSRLPPQAGDDYFYGPSRDADGVELSADSPSPCPGNHVCFAAGPAKEPASHGIYIVADDWSQEQTPSSRVRRPHSVRRGAGSRVRSPRHDPRRPANATERLVPGRTHTVGWHEVRWVGGHLRELAGERADPQAVPGTDFRHG